MKSLPYLLLLLLVVPLHASVRIDGVAARVNGHVITLSDVLGASTDLQALLREGRGGEPANSLYQRVLEELIGRKLILDSYGTQKEIQIPPIAVDAQVQEVIREMFQDDRNAFLRALGEDGRSERAWREEIREQIIVRAMRNLRVDRHVRVSPTAVRARYDADPSRFGQASEWTYRMIVVSAAETDEAQALRDEVQAALQAGEAFESVARRLSEDALADEGGLRGPVDPGQLRDEIRVTLSQLETGAVSPAVSLGQHQVWLQLEERQDGEIPSFESVYNRIQNEIFRERATKLYESWILRLQDRAFVSVVVTAPF